MVAKADTDKHRQQIGRLTELKNRKEYLKCSKDFKYFYFNYWYVQHPPKGDTPGWHLPDKRRTYQAELCDTLQAAHDGTSRRRIIALKARQLGMTTVVMAFVAWCAAFHPGHSWVIASQGESEAQSAVDDKVRPSWERLPKWMTKWLPQQVSKAIGTLSFAHVDKHGARIPTKVRSVAATSKAGRSHTVYGAVIDEAAQHENAGSMYTAIEPSVAGPIIVFSTARGRGNWFSDIWLDSMQENSAWLSKFWPWDAVPERDQAWYEETKRSFRDRPWAFFQEYPSTPEEAFSKSGRTAFSSELVREHDIGPSQFLYRYDVAERIFIPTADMDDEFLLEVWELPWDKDAANRHGFEAPNYVIGADIAQGLEYGDYTVGVVINALTGNQAARIRTHIELEYSADMLAALGEMYETALLGPEANSFGRATIDDLRNVHRYRRLYRQRRLASRNGKKFSDFGYHTNKNSKPKMVADMQLALKKHEIQLHDEMFLTESQTFVANGRGSYDAVQGKHDDVLIATMIAWQMAKDADKFPIVHQPKKDNPMSYKMLFPWLFDNTRSTQPTRAIDAKIGVVASGAHNRVLPGTPDAE